GERSLSNSGAVLRHPALRTDWVRAGIMAYGGSPDHPAHDAAHWGLAPAMTLRTRLIAVQSVRAGETVGYGSTYRAPGAMRVGIAACGYADGYPRHAGTGTPVLVDGIRTRTVGRVSMDMLAVDLSPCPEAGIGSVVTLWGRGPGGAVLAIDEVAYAAGTIGYELMCAVAPRVAMCTAG
ncbi:MAG: alanine racemase, partial [Betaproteobacteria bacterium]